MVEFRIGNSINLAHKHFEVYHFPKIISEDKKLKGIIRKNKRTRNLKEIQKAKHHINRLGVLEGRPLHLIYNPSKNFSQHQKIYRDENGNFETQFFPQNIRIKHTILKSKSTFPSYLTKSKGTFKREDGRNTEKVENMKNERLTADFFIKPKKSSFSKLVRKKHFNFESTSRTFPRIDTPPIVGRSRYIFEKGKPESDVASSGTSSDSEVFQTPFLRLKKISAQDIKFNLTETQEVPEDINRVKKESSLLSSNVIQKSPFIFSSETRMSPVQYNSRFLQTEKMISLKHTEGPMFQQNHSVLEVERELNSGINSKLHSLSLSTLQLNRDKSGSNSKPILPNQTNRHLNLNNFLSSSQSDHNFKDRPLWLQSSNLSRFLNSMVNPSINPSLNNGAGKLYTWTANRFEMDKRKAPVTAIKSEIKENAYKLPFNWSINNYFISLSNRTDQAATQFKIVSNTIEQNVTTGPATTHLYHKLIERINNVNTSEEIKAVVIILSIILFLVLISGILMRLTRKRYSIKERRKKTVTLLRISGINKRKRKKQLLCKIKKLKYENVTADQDTEFSENSEVSVR